MKKMITLMFLLALLVPTICLAADVGIVNHVMAEKIECAPGKGCLINGPTSIMFEMPAGETASMIKFTSLDQLMFLVGTFNVEQNILQDVTGQVVASAKHNKLIITSNQEIRHLTTDWKVAAKMGIYTYQLKVNNEEVAMYKFRVAVAK